MIDVQSISYRDMNNRAVAINVNDMVSFDYMQPLSPSTNRVGRITRIRILSPNTKVSKGYRRNDPSFRRGSILITLNNEKSFYIDRSIMKVVTHV